MNTQVTARATGSRSTLALGIHRARYEVGVYFRSPDQVFFTFLFPVMMFALFATIFSSSFGAGADGEFPAVTAAQFYLPGMIAAGILLSGTQNLATDIATERHDGTVKRLGGTPLPVASYFIGKFGQVLVTGTAQLIVLLLVAVLGFGATLPETPQQWLTFVWVYLLSLAVCALLGIALSALPRSGKSAAAVVIPIVLILQFISGVYLAFSLLPEWLQNFASVFPLKWIAQGMRFAFLPDEYSIMEQSGEWNLAGVAIALAIWLVVGLVLARLTFRWTRRDA